MSCAEANTACLRALIEIGLPTWLGDAEHAMRRVLSPAAHAHIPKWQRASERLPRLTSATAVLDQAEVGVRTHFEKGQRAHLENQLRALMPWRKGPFFIGEDGSGEKLLIDTEWRSDMKWERIAPHLPDLSQKLVLDVGGGSGYHAFRMAGLGAHAVFNLEPSPLFYYQFQAIRALLAQDRSVPKLPHFLPMTLAEAGAPAHFDVVFCMGVLYHRPDVFGFLDELKAKLKSGGTLVLETLVVEGDDQTVLVPQERYAQMNNVFFLPSVAALTKWLVRAGFESVSCIDESVTEVTEQRSTAWMQFHSLPEFLHATDTALTTEGLPRPRRATLLAHKA